MLLPGRRAVGGGMDREEGPLLLAPGFPGGRQFPIPAWSEKSGVEVVMERTAWASAFCVDTIAEVLPEFNGGVCGSGSIDATWENILLQAISNISSL